MDFIYLLFAYISCIYSIKCSHSESQYIPKNWVDPNDLRNYDRTTKSMKQADVFVADNESDFQQCTVDFAPLVDNYKNEILRYEVFMERFINRFIRLAGLSEQNVNQQRNFSSKILMKISQLELITMLNYGKKFSSSQLDELDKIFVNIFTGEWEPGFSLLDSYVNPFYKLLESKEKITILMVSIVFAFTLWMFGTGKGIIRIMTFLYLTFFLFGFVWNFWHKYQESLIKQYVDIKKYPDIPDDCNPYKMSWFSYFLNIFKSSNDCVVYYTSRSIEPLSLVNPALILSDTFFSMVILPLGKLGNVLGDFTSGLIKNIPWPLNWVLFPLVLILVMIFVLFCISLHLRQSVKFWSWFGGITLGGYSEHRPAVQYDVIETADNLLTANLVDSQNNYILVRKTAIHSVFSAYPMLRGNSYNKKPLFTCGFFGSNRASSNNNHNNLNHGISNNYSNQLSSGNSTESFYSSSTSYIKQRPSTVTNSNSGIFKYGLLRNNNSGSITDNSNAPLLTEGTNPVNNCIFNYGFPNTNSNINNKDIDNGQNNSKLLLTRDANLINTRISTFGFNENKNEFGNSYNSSNNGTVMISSEDEVLQTLCRKLKPARKLISVAKYRHFDIRKIKKKNVS